MSRRIFRPCASCPDNPRRRNKFCDGCIENGRHLHRKPLEALRDEQCIREYLLRTREHRCAVCKLTEWLDQPIPLETDHIDGNSDNNTEENLRLICPNCHARTLTYRSRNRGNGRTRQRIKNERYAQGLKY